MIKKNISQITRVTIAFSLIVVVAGLLGFFFEPSILGAVVLNNQVDKINHPTLYLFVSLAFFVVYALYLNIKK
ncbi:MAG: hypothetical protein U9O94_08800 [Nanoarchaeota archaeon]|nr:hypothetical protein [Nanoarchaeota archaeon]